MTCLYAHEITFNDLVESKLPVVTAQGELIGGPDRRTETPQWKWLQWQQAVVAAALKSGAVPADVMEYFQATKHLRRPPQAGDIDILRQKVLDTKFIPPEPPVPQKQVKRFSWSYTSLTDFENCPHAYAQKRIYKTVTEEESIHQIWGTRVHEAAEKSLKGQAVDDPEVMKLLNPYLGLLKKLPGQWVVEGQFAVTPKWGTCDWWSGWGRGVIDFAAIHDGVARIFDWKTGAVKQDQTQLEIFCLFLAIHHPEIHTFDAKFIWLKEGKVTGLPQPIGRKDLLPVIQSMSSRIKRMEEAYEEETYQAKRGGLCQRWCPVLSCVHNGKGRR